MVLTSLEREEGVDGPNSFGIPGPDDHPATTRERLAGLILEKDRGAGGGSFGLGGSQSAVAEELGTVREVVVRMLGELRRAGLIRSAGRGRLEVTDLPALRRLAGTASQRPAGSAMR